MSKGLKILVTIIITCVFLYCLSILIKIYSADKYSYYSQNLLEDNKYVDALSYANRAVKNNPYEPLYYIKRARIYFALSAQENKDSTFSYKILALEDMLRAYKLNETNLITMKHLIPLYYFLSTKDITKPAGVDNIDLEFLEISKDFYNSIFYKAHNDVGFYVLLYKYEKRLGLHKESELAKERIEELRPDILEWYQDLE